MTAELAIPTRMGIPDKMEYARTLAGADLLPRHFQKQPANVLWAIEYGEALRLPTIAAITGVHVMDGKPTPSAALMSALVRRAGHRLRVSHDPSTQHGILGKAWCEIVRADDPEYTFRTEWTVERAAGAELCQIKDGAVWHRTHNNKTGNWQKHPIAMMKARAMAECARDACEEALMGMHYLAEELGADVDEDGSPVRSAVTVTPLHTPDHDDAEPSEDVVEPDWDASLAEHEQAGNRAALVDLWKMARQLRPTDTELQGRITAAGERLKAAQAQPAAAGGGDDVVDAEVVDAPAVEDEPAQPAGNPRMFALLGEAELGGNTAALRDRRLKLMSNVLNRAIGSSKELTPDDRQQVIAALERWKRNGDLDRAEECAQEEAALEQLQADGEQGEGAES